MDPRLRPLVIALAMTVLVAYLACFFSHVAAYLWPAVGVPRLGAGEGFDHIWTSVSVLIGSVVAIALGQPVEQRRTGVGWWEERLIIFYAWGWLVVGVVACLVWALDADGAVPTLIKNAATAFIGLVIPVVSSFFRDSDRTGRGRGDGEPCPESAQPGADPIGCGHGQREPGSAGTPSIADLDLAEHAKGAAEALKTKFPSIVFTSGRRTVSEQASAMAGNVVKNRKWIEQTYAASTERDTLQTWVNDNPSATTKATIATGLQAIMAGWTDRQRLNLSRHFAGLAFDLEPSTQEVKDYIKKLPHYVKFLDNEGGIVIWHAEFASN